MTSLALRTPLRADAAIRAGVRDIIPIIVGVVPFAMTIGATAVASPINDFAAWLGGPLIAAGAAHLTVITLVGAGTSAVGVIITALVVNSRLAAYSAVLAPAYVGQPQWFKLVGPIVLVDQTFALALDHLDDDERSFRRYMLTACSVLLAAWVVAITVGMALGPIVPLSWELWFALPLMFTAMTMPALKDRASVVSALTATGLAIGLSGLTSGFGLIVAILGGATTGYFAGKWR